MKKDLISMEDLTLSEVKDYLVTAAKVEEMPLEERVKLLPGRVMAALFFEPSTRTRLSFESAMHRLGGSVIGFAAKDARRPRHSLGFSGMSSLAWGPPRRYQCA